MAARLMSWLASRSDSSLPLVTSTESTTLQAAPATEQERTTREKEAWVCMEVSRGHEGEGLPLRRAHSALFLCGHSSHSVRTRTPAGHPPPFTACTFPSTCPVSRVSPPLGKPSTTRAAPERLPRESVPRRKGSCQVTRCGPCNHTGERPATQTAGARACLGDTSPT